MPLKPLIILVATVILLAGLSLAIAFWVSDKLPGGGSGWTWLIPLFMAVAVFVRIWARRNDP